MRIDAGNTAFDPLLDFFEFVRRHVDVLRGFREDVFPGQGCNNLVQEISQNILLLHSPGQNETLL